MKVLMINGSSHEQGCTFTALNEAAGVLEQQGIETELIQLGTAPIRDCTACGACRKLGGRCAYDDDLVNAVIDKAKAADGFIFGSPVYYAHPSGRILSFLDRLFYAGSSAFAFKPGAAVVSARRAGTTASLDVLNKYFTIARMPVVSSNYWNMIHGNDAGEAVLDQEGVQIMRVLGENMAWLLRCIEAGGKNGIQVPQTDPKIYTNFIR